MGSSSPTPAHKNSAAICYSSTVSWGRFRASGVEESRLLGRQLFYDHKLQLHQKAEPRSTMALVRSDILTISHVTYGAGVRLWSEGLETAYQFNVALGGRVFSKCGNAESLTVGRTAAVFNTIGEIDMEWSADCMILGLKIDRNFLMNQLEALTGASANLPLSFSMALELERPEFTFLNGLSQALSSQLKRSPHILGMDEISHLAALLSDQLIMNQPNNYSARLDRGHKTLISRQGLAGVLDAIHHRPGHPWTAAELASIAGTGIRSLQETFRRQHEMSIFAYLRAVRLDLARKRLIETNESVEQVARACGIPHGGRFAAHYRARFGESPQESRSDVSRATSNLDHAIRD